MGKNVFYIHTDIETKKWGGKKRSKQFVLKHTNSAAKIVEEKPSGKSAKKNYLYSHEYRDQKKGKKTSETIFQKVTNSALKMLGKK